MEDVLANYEYLLPPEMIARHPPAKRDDARMMVVDRKTGEIRSLTIRDLPGLLNTHDHLVLNNTRVVPARLYGRRDSTGGRWEGLFLRELENGCWQFIGQTRGRLKPGERITLRPARATQSAGADFSLTLLERDHEGIWTARPSSDERTFSVLNRFGTVPLPPYMHREEIADEDYERYQTVYAEAPGSVAAPTAGFHFTPEILDACSQKSIQRSFLTLHIGIGTFRPIEAARLVDHRMHTEWCDVPMAVVEAILASKAAGGRCVAVGTTSVRSLETAAMSGTLSKFTGQTDLFIRPPFEFRAVDLMLTNFHLPRSSLLVLVCAFAGRELVFEAYRKAIEQKFRFYSYGDAMLLV